MQELHSSCTTNKIQWKKLGKSNSNTNREPKDNKLNLLTTRKIEIPPTSEEVNQLPYRLWNI